MVVTSEAKKGWGKLEVDDLPRKGSELYDIDTVGWWQELHQAHKNARLIWKGTEGNWPSTSVSPEKYAVKSEMVVVMV